MLLHRLRPSLCTLARAPSAAPLTRFYSRRPRFADDDGWYGQKLRATTILTVRKDDQVVSADGRSRARADCRARDPVS